MSVVDHLGYEVGDAFVGQADVVAGRGQPAGHSPVLLFQFADAFLERGVLRGDPYDVGLGPFRLQVANLAEEFGDQCALVQASSWVALSVSSVFSARA
ncbi:hypothetical protein ACWGLG_16895 [Streptomyces antimycoticus]|nr:hypothetical protein [Streptomyces antimycoticus]